MILEAIVTTRNEDGSTNIAPMGPQCDSADFNTFELRPFDSSSTFRNLTRARQGVLNICDDVRIYAYAATRQIGKLSPSTLPSGSVDVDYLEDSCRYYDFEVTHVDATQNRSSMQCKIVGGKRLRDFFGFNRAKSAIIEASILATRVNFIPVDEIIAQFGPLSTIVNKTGGPNEEQAMKVLNDYVLDFSKTFGQSSS